MGSNPIESTNLIFNNMTYNEFVSDVLSLVDECPRSWRRGQSVFNVVDAKYGVARTVQFIDGVDCFYDNEQIEQFLLKAYERLKEQESCEN